MQGFDREFENLDHYIRVITERIWEGRRVRDIERWYSADCAVETPTGVSIGAQAVIDATLSTLHAFPDRQLLCEDMLESGDARSGFLSSHRVASTMGHLGDGIFGAPTGRRIHMRAMADCVCRGNQVIHEWMIRDAGAVARQIGSDERTLAQRWLAERGPIEKATMPPAPAPYVSHVATTPLAQSYAELYRAAWRGAIDQVAQTCMRDVQAAIPGGDVLWGVGELQAWWTGWVSALPGATFEVEHLAEVRRPERSPAVAMRWRVRGVHAGWGRWGRPSGRPVEIMGISHAEFDGGRMVREWIVADEVAIWMQILEPQR